MTKTSEDETLNDAVSASLAEFKQTYPVVVERSVDWGEMDSLGHVNNIIYLRYFENARMAYFLASGVLSSDGPKQAAGPILAEVGCRYKRPLVYPDTIYMGSRIETIESDRFTMKQAVFGKHADFAVAEGPALIVAYDYGLLKKTTVPTQWLEGIARLQPELF